MASFFVGKAEHAASGYAVHDRSRCPADCFGTADAGEYLGKYEDADQALAVARLRYRSICHCERRDTVCPWPQPVWPAAQPFNPPPP